MSRKIFVVGEGERDVGRQDAVFDGPFVGDLPRLLFRLSAHQGGPARFGYEGISLLQVRRDNPPRPHLTRRGSPTRELRGVIEALVRRSPSPLAIVAVIDARPEVLDDYERDLVERLEPAAGSVPLAVGFAVPEIEAWLLADAEARRLAFPTLDPERVPVDPETIDDPKRLWAQLDGEVATAGVDRALAADDRRRVVWESLRADVVERACRRGFSPFLFRLRRAVLPVLGC